MLGRSGVALVAIAIAMLAADAGAQEEVQWKQVLNVEKGRNLPEGVKGDVLGIELGASLADAKAKLDALLAEGIPEEPERDPYTGRALGRVRQGIQEDKTVIRGSQVQASYTGRLYLSRKLKGKDVATTDESIEVHLSAPSSGNQVVQITRRIAYGQSDQVRISDLVAKLSEKFRSKPQIFSETVHVWQFNDGKPFVSSKKYPRLSCVGVTVGANSNEVERINENGECDVRLEVNFNTGISKDHAASMSFELSDNERMKANYAADYRFFEDYVNELRHRTSGAAPKL